MAGPIKALVVDDSALMRKLIGEILNSDPGIQVVGTANDAFDARNKIKQLDPDVLTLDVEMPKMDGIKFLSNLMRLRPMPVVMVSTLTERGASVTLQALELGAVDFVSKPKIDVAHSMNDYAAEIIGKVKLAARAHVRQLPATPVKTATIATPAAGGSLSYTTTDKVIAIGASTGGTEAIREVLSQMRSDCPGIVIAQHIPPVFSRSFAERLNNQTPFTVCEAQDGQQVRPGHVYVAPGDWHLRIIRNGAKYVCRVEDTEHVNLHRPAVDVLFDSVAEAVGHNAVGVILTGMGKDGARGLCAMRKRGAYTIAQDEQSSVVWGMPGAAVKLGGATAVKPLNQVAGEVMSQLSRMRNAS